MKLGPRGHRRALAATLALVAIGGVAAGCGDDEDSSSGDSKAEQTKQPGSLGITATGPKGAPKYTVPESAPAGAVNIAFTNSNKDTTDAQLLRVEGEHTDEEVLAEYAKATEGKAVAEWFKAAGGVGEVKPGDTTTVTQVLEPGKHYVVSGQNEAKDPPPTFEVTAGEGAPEPETDGTVIATDYAFTGQNLKAGANKIKLSNDGKQWHHFLAAALKPDATIEGVKKFFEDEKGEPPFAEEEGEVGLETAVMEGGVSQIVDVQLKPGRYAFYCFVADREGGPPHVAKGMVSEVTVAE